MNLRAHALILSRDADLIRKLQAFSDGLADVHTVSAIGDLEAVTQGLEGFLLLLDLRTPDFADSIAFAAAQAARCAALAFAVPDSEPARLAQVHNLYAVVDPDAERQALQHLLTRAVEHVTLMQTCAELRNGPAAGAAAAPPATASSRLAAADTHMLRAFDMTLQKVDSVEALCRQIVEGLAVVTRVSRVGLFCRADDNAPYTLQAGVRCLERSRTMSFPANHPLCLWLQAHAHLLARPTLDHVPLAEDRLMLRQTMDLLGAEVMIPVHTRQRFVGWLILGHQATGRPFTQPELEELMSLTDHVAVVVENALLFREVAHQKAFAETLLRSLPIGVIATTWDGQVYWFNAAAESILSLNRNDVLGRPAEQLGMPLARALRACLDGQPAANECPEWVEPTHQLVLAVRTARLPEDAGAVAFVFDRTPERMLNRRQQELERTAFWTELAASMSHEIRNPMVAIKTFAQLLPEHYADPEFRSKFSTLVAAEVDRLNAIIQQINSFASRPKLSMEWVGVPDLLDEGRRLAATRLTAGEPNYTLTLDKGLPQVFVDRRAFAECLAHLFTNAGEALQQKPDGQIRVAGRLQRAANGAPDSMEIVVSDNAGGIPAAIRDNVFSPFCTTKARAMGLGLPIAQRTMADHHGHVAITHTDRGTDVHLTLPLDHRQQEPSA